MTWYAVAFVVGLVIGWLFPQPGFLAKAKEVQKKVEDTYNAPDQQPPSDQPPAA